MPHSPRVHRGRIWLLDSGSGELGVVDPAGRFRSPSVPDTPEGSRLSGTVTLQSIDDAIDTVSTIRSTFGAVQNRLEHTLNNLASYEENLTASESRIKDVDMASEMVQFTKYQILQQAGTSMLAQANSAPQSVLSLLRG